MKYLAIWTNFNTIYGNARGTEQKIETPSTNHLKRKPKLEFKKTFEYSSVQFIPDVDRSWTLAVLAAFIQ